MGATQLKSIMSSGVNLELSSEATSFLFISHPTKVQMSKPPKGMRNLAVMKSKSSKNVMPITVTSFHKPKDRLQMMPKVRQIAVTTMAALGRVSLNVSCMYAVPISCMEMVLVRAAKTRRT